MTTNPLYEVLKARRHRFDSNEIARLFSLIDRGRVEALAHELTSYISNNLPAAFERREGLSDYRTNPYVMMTTATVMDLGSPKRFADFLFNSKLYMALETSFGKSIEAAFVSPYPVNSRRKWEDPPEKIAESAELNGLTLEEKARRRTASVWREIDKSCVIKKRRYLTSIKSGPNTINDTQVQAMTQAIIDKHLSWAEQTRSSYPEVKEIDVVLGLTYGTDRTTNNKENQILAKLLERKFEEEDRRTKPGVLVDKRTHSVRVYRCIGKDFWAFIGRPDLPSQANYVFLEVLLSLAKALSVGIQTADLETRINTKLRELSAALQGLTFPRKSLPKWVQKDFSEDALFWFATAMTAFYDEGI
jgi:hypothetical protein